MNLENQTDKVLWELYQGLKLFPDGEVIKNARYDILQELIRKEKEQK